jgi:simple sugar transport system ATP-binding protein
VLEVALNGSPIIELKNISKSYGSVLALSGVNFQVNDNEILGLIGDNGAGKSTLIKIISGVHAPGSGEILVDGETQKKWNVNIARLHGIETVYQDRALAEQQTITRNIFMGRERTGFLGFLKLKEENEEADNLMRGIGFTSRVFSPDSLVFTLSGGERQGVAIARALYFKAKMIILDEPTTALSLTESEKVFHFVRQAKEGGASCVFISHNIYHTYDISDRFVVLDRGRVVLETDKTKITADELVKSLQDIARSGHAA